MDKTSQAIYIKEIQAFRKEVTASVESSARFLERAGIMKNGKLTKPYRENNTISYRYGLK